MAALLSLRLLSLLLIGALAEPAPGRIPKVYNALITSNQNLEPSKAYPVYQPVLHDAFGFSYQPALFYGGDILGNGIFPPPPLTPKEPPKPETTVKSSDTQTEGALPSTESPASAPEPAAPDAEKNNSTPPPPSEPNTQSPIPLNAFGLPPQVIPLGHIDPIYNALPQFSPFAYRYPSFRFYDPYDPFSFSPYSSFSSLYQPLPSFLGHNFPVIPNKEAPTKAPATPEPSAQTPPNEPNDLTILNYSSKDPAIPNVPPPPLPQGGLKDDKAE